jgi:hypothetical protein
MKNNLILLLLVGSTILYTIPTPDASLDGEFQPVKNVNDKHIYARKRPSYFRNDANGTYPGCPIPPDLARRD